jgi:hypothetical protein
VRRHRAFAGIGLLAVVGFLLLSVTTGYASTASTNSVSTKAAFPSSTSTVVGSTGFINGTEIGYFWSAARGDSVSQTIHGPSSIKRAILKLDVVTNVLSDGAEVDWDILINGIPIGHFVVHEGQTGLVKFKAHFGRIIGPDYNVLLKVTNEVPSGDGSHTLAYAGAFPHSIQLLKKA